MQMGMQVKVLSPGVKDGEKTDRRAQMLRIGRNREQGFRYRAEQDAIDQAHVLKRQAADLQRQRKYNVEVRDRQQFGLPVGQPFGARHGLAFWAMPIAARIIGDDLMSAVVALLNILHVAAEGGRAAVANRFKGFSLTSAKHMSPSREEIAFIFAKNIGQFKSLFPHRFGSSMALAA